jgi:hypothetical protein
MAKYLVLIYGDERRWDAMTPEEWRQVDEGHRAFVAAAGGKVSGSGRLQNSDTATTLRADATGRVAPIDGPFLETKEAIGGFYLLDAADLDEVIALVNRLYEVTAGHSGVEIRALYGSS